MEENDFDIIFLGSGFHSSALIGACQRHCKTLLLDKAKMYGSEFSPNESQIHSKSSLIYANGGIVELLVKSQIGELLEFQLVKDLLFSDIQSCSDQSNIVTERVPSSKQDVFVSKSITLLEKRKLMKLFTYCLEKDGNGESNPSDGQIDPMPANFVDFLNSFGISKKYVNVILKCLTFNLNSSEISTNAGIDLLKLYLTSIGKYGDGALLSAVYGTGSELCQAFCRYAAVYGSTFILDCQILNVIHTSSGYTVKTRDFGDFTTKKIVVEYDYLQDFSSSFVDSLQLKVKKTKIYHSMLKSTTPILETENHALQIFIGDSGTGAYGIQYIGDTKMCQDSEFLLHIWSSDLDCFNSVIEKLVTENVSILAKYETNDIDIYEASTINDSCVTIGTCGWNVMLDNQLLMVKDQFMQLCPGSEFYPPR